MNMRIAHSIFLKITMVTKLNKVFWERLAQITIVSNKAHVGSVVYLDPLCVTACCDDEENCVELKQGAYGLPTSINVH